SNARSGRTPRWVVMRPNSAPPPTATTTASNSTSQDGSRSSPECGNAGRMVRRDGRVRFGAVAVTTVAYDNISRGSFEMVPIGDSDISSAPSLAQQHRESFELEALHSGLTV